MKRLRSNQLCACGCGEYTLISDQYDKKGKPNKFLCWHNVKGKNHHQWNGGIIKRSDGYITILQKNHPHTNSRGYVRRAHLVVERAMGKYLPEKAIVHHVNGVKTDDSPKNLVVCEDQAYHVLLHQRTRALKDCGHANWLKCKFCKQYDNPNNLYVTPNGRGCHRECRRKYDLENRKIINQKQREWRFKNRKEVNQKQREYRARKKEVFHGTIG